MKHKTAVEWYQKETNALIEKYEAKEISKRDFITMMHNLFYEAEKIEKQRVIGFAEWCLHSLLSGEEPKAESMEELLEIYHNQIFKIEV